MTIYLQIQLKPVSKYNIGNVQVYSEDRKDVIVILIIHIKIVEAHIPSWISVIEARVHIALHLMKKIQIVH